MNKIQKAKRLTGLQKVEHFDAQEWKLLDWHKKLSYSINAKFVKDFGLIYTFTGAFLGAYLAGNIVFFNIAPIPQAALAGASFFATTWTAGTIMNIGGFLYLTRHERKAYRQYKKLHREEIKQLKEDSKCL